MNKKNLLIIISIIIILALGIWYFFFNSPTTIPTTPTQTGSPFGNGGGDVVPNTTNNKPGQNGLDTSGRPMNKLFQVSATPVAGAVAILKNGSTIIRYVDRATGHIFDINPETLEKTVISNTTLPKIYEAVFNQKGDKVVFRSLKENTDNVVSTAISLTAPKSTSTGETLYTLSSAPIKGSLESLALLPSGNIVFATSYPGSIQMSSFVGDKLTNIYNSQFSEWNIAPQSTTTVIITNKASSNVSGYAYSLSTTNGALKKVLGPLDSLNLITSLNKNLVAYSYKQNGVFALEVSNLSTKTVLPLSPAVFVDKCVWSNKKSMLYCGVPAERLDQNEPDVWYQGITHYSDRIWAFNTSTTFTDVLAEPKKDLGVSIDTENLSLSPDEDYLIFMNKTDLSLWALKLI